MYCYTKKCYRCIAIYQLIAKASGMKDAARLLMIIGAVLFLIGAVWHFAAGPRQWFGRLPGDIRLERPGFRIYMPIVSMLLLSLLMSGAWWLIRKIWHLLGK